MDSSTASLNQSTIMCNSHLEAHRDANPPMAGVMSTNGHLQATQQSPPSKKRKKISLYKHCEQASMHRMAREFFR